MTSSVVGQGGRMQPRSVTIDSWRHSAAAWSHFPGVRLGKSIAVGDADEIAQRLYLTGARLVEIDEMVELESLTTGERDHWALSLVRELTARAIDVSWVLRADFTNGAEWWDISHLVPPRAIYGDGASVLDDWRDRHYIGRCAMRRGAGFLQIRDRRRDDLRTFLLDDPEYVDAVGAILNGTSPQHIPASVREAFVDERLLVPVGDRLWWAPYRLRRWPLPCWEV